MRSHVLLIRSFRNVSSCCAGTTQVRNRASILSDVFLLDSPMMGDPQLAESILLVLLLALILGGHFLTNSAYGLIYHR